MCVGCLGISSHKLGEAREVREASSGVLSGVLAYAGRRSGASGAVVNGTHAVPGLGCEIHQISLPDSGVPLRQVLGVIEHASCAPDSHAYARVCTYVSSPTAVRPTAVRGARTRPRSTPVGMAACGAARHGDLGGWLSYGSLVDSGILDLAAVSQPRGAYLGLLFRCLLPWQSVVVRLCMRRQVR